ncbi:hypothetical protein ACNHUS_34595 [Actinomycetes bacterium M1A6_2h]
MWSGCDVVYDVADGSWVDAAITEFTAAVSRHGSVGSVLPPAFEAYARVLHRARRSDGTPEGAPVRWSEVATRNGRLVHPLVEWASIHPSDHLSQPGVWDRGPGFGRPDRVTIDALKRVLSTHSSAARCWFAVWEGNTALDEIRGEGTRLRVAGYDCFVVRDDISVAGATLLGVAPSYWWPDDRSWCVASNSDLMSTYVGGTRACIDAVLAHPRLEAFPIAATDTVTADGDTVNPPWPTH